MSNIATDAHARKSFFHFRVIPDFIFEDAYFTRLRPGGITALDGLVRVVYRFRRSDNCVTKRLQTEVTLKTLAEEFGWTVKAVRYFIDKCLKLRIFGYELGTKRGKCRGTSHAKITYTYQQLLEDEWGKKGKRKGALGADLGRSDKESRNLKEDIGQDEPDRQPEAAREFYPDDSDPEPAQPDGAGPHPEPDQDYGKSNHSEASGAGTSQQPSEDYGKFEDSPAEAGPKGSARDAGYAEAFEKLWSTCPRRKGTKGSKAKAYAKWKRLSEEKRADAQRGAEIWAKRVGDVISEFSPMAQVWINGERWETEIEEHEPRAADQKSYNDFFKRMAGECV
jgi:hypothetical protein